VATICATDLADARERLGRVADEAHLGFEGLWHKGYVVDALEPDGYVIRRTSDGSLLPRRLPREAVRRERRNSMWWI